jgi:cobalt-zinc-cadmium efflux system outer membrane protein
VAESEQAAAELNRAQREAGNVNDLAVAIEQALAQQTRLDVTGAEADLVAARERLTRLLGLSGTEATWHGVSPLAEVPAREADVEHLESRALDHRLDVAAIRQEVQTLNYALTLARTSRWTGIIDIGADVARLKDGHVVVGPRAAIELPIFDQRRATIARLEAQLRTSERLLEARSIEVRSEVREVHARLLAARLAVNLYRSEIVPTREKLVALSQQQYDAMLLGVYQLVQAKQNEVNAYRGYIETVRDYWMARADLDRAIGGSALSVPAANPVPTVRTSMSGACPKELSTTSTNCEERSHEST